jgi:hypothetical protein
VRCAPGPVSTGLAALDTAGISWEGTRRFPGFVCRIAGKPAPEAESCGNTPPATAYWSYWIAPRGGPWCYSTIGAGNRTPPPGTVEGWSFALDRVAVDIPPPGYDPPAPIPGEPPNPLKGGDCGTPASPSPSPAPTAAPTTAAPTTTVAAAASPVTTVDQSTTATTSDVVQDPVSPAAPGVAPATTSAGATSTSSTGSSTVTRSAPSTTSPPGSTGTATTAPDDTSQQDTTSSLSAKFGAVDLGDDGRGDGGFGPATAIGLAVAALLAGAGVWVARRRRAVQ